MIENPVPAAESVASPASATGLRIVAALIDAVLMGVLFLVMAAAFGDFGKKELDGGGTTYQANLWNGPFLLYLLAMQSYFILFEWLLSATPGKIILGVKVVRADGSPYTFVNALMRNLLRFIDGLPFLYLVGLVSVAVTQKRQRLGDLAAGTIVVRA